MASLATRKLKDPNILRIFFSSPFGGMEEEREELTRKYFPQFHHACNARGVQFVAVDMRWGITSEAADNAQVINICLRELDRSDVFVGFFGQRYGWHGENDKLLQNNFDNAVSRYPWLNDVRDRSVTELEFLHGHLNSPGSLPVCICFRDKEYDDNIRDDALAKEDSKTVYKYSAESDHSSEMMSDLIRRVQESEEKALGIKVGYKNPHEGAKFMFETVFSTCIELLEQRDTHVLSPLEQARISHDAKMATLTSVFVGGEEYLQSLNSYHLTANSKHLVYGSQGCGKSALLANVVKTLKEEVPDLNVIYHFLGSGPKTTDPVDILKRILSELQFINDEKSSTREENVMQSKTENDDKFELHNIYTNILKEMEKLSSQGKRLVLVIDALNKEKQGDQTAKHLFWLPKEYPSGVSIVVSTVTSDTATYDLLVTEQGYVPLEVRPLSLESQKRLCEESLLKSGKEFSPPQLQRVVDAEQTKNPLFLKTFLGEVSIYGHFFSLDEKIDSLIYSDGVRDLLTKVLTRLEQDYNVKEHSGFLVEQVLSVIAVSHRGLTEKEIQEMFDLASHVWSPFYFALENYLISHGGFLRFSFTEMLEAVKERYLRSEQARIQAIRSVVRYFTGILKEWETTNYLEDNTLKRIVMELPWLQVELGDQDGLSETLCDMRLFYLLVSHSKSETIVLWKESGLSADTLCRNLLKSFDNCVANLYLHQEEIGDPDAEPPGYILLPLLKTSKEFFGEICHHESRMSISQRTISILEGLRGLNVEDDVRVTLLREEKYYLATYYVDNSQYKAGEQLLRTVKEECERHLETYPDDPRAKQTLAYSCNGIGAMYMNQSRHEYAEEFFQKSADIHQSVGNEECVTDALQNIGLVKLAGGQLESSLEYFQRALEDYERFYFGHLPMIVGNLMHNMAIVQRRMGNLDEAEKMYLRSMEVKAQAVGWGHEVVAAGFMNLGSLEMHRKNYDKAEEYTRKALKIHENNNVKLEHNTMWQPLENLAHIKLLQGKPEDALGIFLPVFEMLKREEKVYQGFTYLHQQMMNFMVDQGKFVELIGVLEAYVTSPELRDPQYFRIMDHCYKSLSPEQSQLLNRPQEHTVEYALKEIWPGDNGLTTYFVQNYVMPENDIDKLLELLDAMDKHNPDFLSSTYLAGTVWCEGVENWLALVRVAKAGLEKYPEALDLKTKLFDALRRLQQYTEAYPLLEAILADQQDNQGLILVAGQVALMANDTDLCRDLWGKASNMPDQELAQKAKGQLVMLNALLKEHENNNQSEDIPNQ